MVDHSRLPFRDGVTCPFSPRRAGRELSAFADHRTIWSIPNFWNVVSNLPFAIVGVWGLWRLRGISARVLSTGLLLTCVGSAYYHLVPTDTRLVWDRIPMTLVFMSFLASVIAEGRSPRWEVLILSPLLFLGLPAYGGGKPLGIYSPTSWHSSARYGDPSGILARNWEALAMEDSGAVRGSENRGALRPIDILGSAVERAHLEASSGSRRRVLYCPLVL